MIYQRTSSLDTFWRPTGTLHSTGPGSHWKGRVRCLWGGGIHLVPNFKWPQQLYSLNLLMC